MARNTDRHEAQRVAATANFIAHKQEIDRLLAIIAEESAHHFGVDPGSLTWADANAAAQITAMLTEIKDIVKHEGEYGDLSDERHSTNGV
jgi:hypothetical protein